MSTPTKGRAWKTALLGEGADDDPTRGRRRPYRQRRAEEKDARQGSTRSSQDSTDVASKLKLLPAAKARLTGPLQQHRPDLR
eukprot:2967533-Amphidinium_carterae.1